MTKIPTEYELMSDYIKTNRRFYIGREYTASEYQNASLEFDDNERNYKLTDKIDVVELKIYDGTGEYDIVEVCTTKLMEILSANRT